MRNNLSLSCHIICCHRLWVFNPKWGHESIIKLLHKFSAVACTTYKLAWTDLWSALMSWWKNLGLHNQPPEQAKCKGYRLSFKWLDHHVAVESIPVCQFPSMGFPWCLLVVTAPWNSIGQEVILMYLRREPWGLSASNSLLFLCVALIHDLEHMTTM